MIRAMQNKTQQRHLWLNGGITAVLLIAALYYLQQRVNVRDITAVLSQVHLSYVILTILILLLTLTVKTWRWQLLLSNDNNPPPLQPLFWALMLGQYVNLLLPILRLGEIARIFAISSTTAVSKSQALGTLVVEKVMDLMFLGLTMLLALTAVALAIVQETAVSIPLVTDNNGQKTAVFIGAIATVGLALLVAIALNPRPIVQLTQKLTAWLPPRWGDKIVHIAEAGLGGLAALTNRRLLFGTIGTSIIVAILSVLTPYALFFAFDMPLGIVEAAWLHIIVTLALVPPSSPGKLVVLDGAAIIVLKQFGLTNEALIVGYALLFHLILVAPQLILGAIASTRVGWQWETKQT